MISVFTKVVMTNRELRLFKACRSGRLQIVQEELAAGVDVNCRPDPSKPGCTPLHMATKPEIVRALLRRPGIQVNSTNDNGETPLFFACMYGNRDVVEILLEDERADINAFNAQQCTPLYIARVFGYVDIVNMLNADGRPLDLRIPTSDRYHQINHAVTVAQAGIFQ